MPKKLTARILGTVYGEGEVISDPVEFKTPNGKLRLMQSIAFVTPSGQPKHATVACNPNQSFMRDKGYVGQYKITKEVYPPKAPDSEARYLAIPAIDNFASDDDGF